MFPVVLKGDTGVLVGVAVGVGAEVDVEVAVDVGVGFGLLAGLPPLLPPQPNPTRTIAPSVADSAIDRQENNSLQLKPRLDIEIHHNSKFDSRFLAVCILWLHMCFPELTKRTSGKGQDVPPRQGRTLLLHFHAISLRFGSSGARNTPARIRRQFAVNSRTTRVIRSVSTRASCTVL